MLNGMFWQHSDLVDRSLNRPVHKIDKGISRTNCCLLDATTRGRCVGAEIRIHSLMIIGLLCTVVLGIM